MPRRSGHQFDFALFIYLCSPLYFPNDSPLRFRLVRARDAARPLRFIPISWNFYCLRVRYRRYGRL